MADAAAHGPRFGTLALHAGVDPEPVTGAIMTPIFQTSTYVQPAVAEPKGGRFDYGRTANPTRDALETSIAALEAGKHGVAFSSGIAAIETIVKRLSAGDHVVSEENTYGGTMRLFTRVLARLGIEFTFVDTRDPERIRSAMRPRTKLVHLETPTNPMMRICDIRAAADVTHEGGALLSVDNTYASPYNQRPLQLGADIVVHSSTKYVNGHSDVIGGLVAVRDDGLADELRFLQNSSGAVPGPMDCFLTLRGIKTLHLRMERHNANGLAVARYLEAHLGIDRVIYPGLRGHGVGRRGHAGACQVAQRTPALLRAGREPRRRGIPRERAGPDDPRVGPRGAPRGDGADPGTRALLGGGRGRGRPARGPRARVAVRLVDHLVTST